MREPTDREMHTYQVERAAALILFLSENIDEYLFQNELISQKDEWKQLADWASRALFELYRCVASTPFDGPMVKPDYKFIDTTTSSLEV